MLKKKSLNGQPVQLYVEFGLISDSTVYNNYLSFFPNTVNPQIVIQYMQIYYAQVMNAVNQRYGIALQNDPDLRITIVFTGALIETVCG